MGPKGAVEIIFRSDIGDPEKIAARTKEYEDRFLSPVRRRGARLHRRGDHAARHPPPRSRARSPCCKGKQVEMPARKHDNLPV